MKTSTPPVPGLPRILTIAEVSSYLRVSTPTVYSIIYSGDLHGFSFTGRDGRKGVRVTEDDLKAFLEKRRAVRPERAQIKKKAERKGATG